MKYTNRILVFGLILSAAAGLQSCKTTEEIPEEKPTEVVSEQTNFPIKTISEGYLTGNEEEGIGEGGMVINSQADWDALTTKMNSVNEAIEPQTVDFSKVTVLAFFDQMRGSGGYTVDIVSVKKDGNKLVATVKKTVPKEDAIEIMTQPFMIGFIDKTDLPILFVD
ncbi:MAG: hypothetical protein P8P74_17450 [Crocinitomicaceae bacterium]|nr:hypothetical protein [Crocinitomicaceae bacterium]